MDKSIHQIRLDQWTKIVEECANSTLTKNEWCSQHGVSLKSYYYWQRKVRKNLAATLLPSAPEHSPAFVELKEPPEDNGPVLQNSYSAAPYSVTPAAVIQKGDIAVVLSNSAEQNFITALLGALKNA